MIFFKEVHSSKTLFPISVTDEGIVICDNDLHFLKAQSQIEFTE